MGGYFSKPSDETPRVFDEMVVPVVIEAESTLPTRTTEGTAGYTLCASESATFQPGDRLVINTGVKLNIGNETIYSKFSPRHFVVHGQIRGLSTLAARGIDVFQGTIDADDQEDIKVIIFNNSDTAFDIKQGDKIAQLVFLITLTPDLVAVNTLERTHAPPVAVVVENVDQERV